MNTTTDSIGNKNESKFDSKESTLEHIEEVKANVRKITTKLIHNAYYHDASKLIEPEKSKFDEFIPKLKNAEYGSTEYKNILNKMKFAVEHHNKNNRHHPEYFKNGINGMNLVDIIEMLCDWISASKRNPNGNIFKSIEYNQKKLGYSDNFKNILINTVFLIENKGE